jgi:hypothetical protein
VRARWTDEVTPAAGSDALEIAPKSVFGTILL